MPSPPEAIEWSLVGGRGQTLLLDGGRASGSGGCNRFTGGYRLEAQDLLFEPLATTRMACDPDLMRAEDDYLAALGGVARVSWATTSSSSSLPQAASCFGSPASLHPTHRSLSWS